MYMTLIAMDIATLTNSQRILMHFLYLVVGTLCVLASVTYALAT